MARLVMKFGGTSVADIDRIRNAARHVKREVDAGHEVAVVVSAMAGVTNQLVAWCAAALKERAIFDAREYDAVVATGEQVTAGLMAIALQDFDINARSWQGWQLPIATSNVHSSARILGIAGDELVRRFKERKEVAVIAGFQGVHKETNRVTTLGRGGSDTSAVAIAAAIRADRCDIYTDVDGVYTSDPRVVPRAKRLDKIAFEEMLELASLGAKVMQVRSVELGMVHNVPIFVRSSFDKPEDIDPHPNRAWHIDLQRGGDHGTANRHRHRLLARRGANLGAADAGQTRRRGGHFRSARGGQHQCRHDRAERLGRR